MDVTLDDRLLRSEERQDVVNLSSDIKRFFINTSWDDNYGDLSIPLYVQIIFEGVTEKGNESIYNCQALFSNGGDLRYFDKSVQFYYNSGSSLYYDPDCLLGAYSLNGRAIERVSGWRVVKMCCGNE